MSSGMSFIEVEAKLRDRLLFRKRLQCCRAVDLADRRRGAHGQDRGWPIACRSIADVGQAV
ncbi:hypothetical protein [Bradyrhizobium sp. USDA 4454]